MPVGEAETDRGVRMLHMRAALPPLQGWVRWTAALRVGSSRRIPVKASLPQLVGGDGIAAILPRLFSHRHRPSHGRLPLDGHAAALPMALGGCRLE